MQQEGKNKKCFRSQQSRFQICKGLRSISVMKGLGGTGGREIKYKFEEENVTTVCTVVERVGVAGGGV
jgi:hypothetical protein